MTNYRIVPAPKLSQFHAHNCARCQHEELTHPVWLDDGAGIAPYGWGCAAILLGISTKAVRNMSIDAEMAHKEALRVATFVAALPDDLSAPAWDGLRRNYNRAGGFDVLGGFIAWARAQRDAARALLTESIFA